MENVKTDNQTGRKATLASTSKNNSKCPLFFGDTPLGIKILEFIDGLPFSIFTTIITLITLFSDDIRQIFFTSDADVNFSILTLICMAVYIVEMIALCFLRDGYFLRFYFWMDLISTASMLLDLVWISALIADGGIQTASKVVKIARASRASKIGANSTKLIRIIRLIRILRLYKTAKSQLNKQNKQKYQTQNKKMPIGDDLTPRKASKRMDRVRKASSAMGFPVIRSSGSAPGQVERKNSKKHQVSLKNIAFEGSQRKLSVLHPSKNAIQKSNGQEIAQNNKRVPSLTLKHAATLEQDSGKLAIDHMQSQDNVISDDGQKKQQNQQSQQIQLHAETKVGIKLKEQIQKNIVLMILCILISIPLLNSDTWFNNITSYEKSVNEIQFALSGNQTQFEPQLLLFISEMVKKPEKLVFLSVNFNSTCCQFPKNYPDYIETTKNLSDIREFDIDVYNSASQSLNDITIAFDKTDLSILTSQLNIGRTLFVCILMIIVTLLFTRDVEVQALQPLENMLDTVKKISSNPLQAIKDIQKQNMIKHAIQNKQMEENVNQEDIMRVKEDKKNQTEPTLLENMIVKIGSLLAVGFGQAGTELMAKNIQNYGTLNVMMPGKKVMCIFGFCDIRNFTDATEVLQSKVMVFVNEIAQICHQVVNRVGGNPNKNIGDAFLLVWKFSEDDTTTVHNRHQSSLKLISSLKVQQKADLAVFSFAKMIAETARSNNLQKYKENQGLKNRIKNYEGVKMGFGLHVGWAIQGPIGSEFKIDASYLGSHVNVAGRLQAGTKNYGVPMLISGDLYNLMSLKNRQHLRKIDKVYMGSNQSMELYTVDLSVQNLLKQNGINQKNNLTIFEKKKAKVFHGQQRDKLMSLIQKKRVSAAIWNDDKDIKSMRQPFSSKFFYDQWKSGFEAYEKGDWERAKQIFKKTLVLGLNHNDGPSHSLLQFMQQNNFTPPQKWNGVRDYCA